MNGQEYEYSGLKLSLVTPSYNQAAYIEGMIESVAAQTIRPIEHIIYDAGSSDGTLEFLKEYAGRSFVELNIREDSGQTNAINKGFTSAKGDIIAWLNTDDRYTDCTVVEDILRTFAENPDVDVVYGKGVFVDEYQTPIKDVFVHQDPDDLTYKIINSVGIFQPALFMRKRVFDEIGPLDESLQYCMDYEYWIRLLKNTKSFKHIDRKVAQAVLHDASKSIGAREKQLVESCRMVKRNYGFVPYEWVERLQELRVADYDGLSNEAKYNKEAIRQEIDRNFWQWNDDAACVGAILSVKHTQKDRPQYQACTERIAKNNCVICTAFDSGFFVEGLTLINSVQRFSGKETPILVYDLGLTLDEKTIINNLEGCYLCYFPHWDPRYFEGYFSSRTYGFKPYIWSHLENIFEKDVKVLWLDAGIRVNKDLAPIWRKIGENDIFLVNHDDKDGWPFFNLTFCTDDAAKALGATNAELAAPHIRAGIAGYKVDGRYQQLIADLYAYSMDPKVITGEKHPTETDWRSQTFNERRAHALSNAEALKEVEFNELRTLLGFWGHRHDQAIFSVLAARYGAPAESAQLFCNASRESSELSKSRWQNGGVVRRQDIADGPRSDAENVREAAVCVQHRGLEVEHDALKWKAAEEKPAVIVGNGPSLGGFDFRSLYQFDVFGMNAAYRYWHQIGWYPQYYSCLDLTVGMSHKKEIGELVASSDKCGIKLFLLRDNLVRYLEGVKNFDRVINFDNLTTGSALLGGARVTTGSHTAAWAAYLGYREIYLLGIDCNYTEVIEGAERRKGTELELVSTPENNPNYFFDGYQQEGDKFNVPNPGGDIHVEAWRELGEVLRDAPVVVRNANPQSRVDAFDCGELPNVKGARGEPDVRAGVMCVRQFWTLDQVKSDTPRVTSAVSGAWPDACNVGVNGDAAQDTEISFDLAYLRSNGIRGLVIRSNGQMVGGGSREDLNVADSARQTLAREQQDSSIPYIIARPTSASLSEVQGILAGGQVRPVVELSPGRSVERCDWTVVGEIYPQSERFGYRVFSVQESPAAQGAVLAELIEVSSTSDLGEVTQGVFLVPKEYLRVVPEIAERLRLLGSTARERLRAQGLRLLGIRDWTGQDISSAGVTLSPPAKDHSISAIFKGLVIDGDYLLGVVQFRLDRSCELELKLCRHGQAPFESVASRREMSAGSHVAVLGLSATCEHEGARIQIACASETATITDITPYITRVGSDQITSSDGAPVEAASVRMANSAFRSGDYWESMAWNLELMKRRPLQMYGGNIRHCLLRLGYHAWPADAVTVVP